ncbi:hypothetical protein [Rhizobium sullae]|uniref:hypothetical protein n=1 Tax=Rhizobium sullae TaxID=50338 RepID=UPI00117BAD84|nr:hypothetical protein [Rhizobium sullae]
MKYQLIMVMALLSGCATSASPTFDRGNYFMTGDASCVTYQAHVSRTHIVCRNAQGQPTERREAMTPQQMQMYAYQQQAAQAQQQQQAAAYSYQPMPMVQYPQMVTPQVAPLTLGSGNQVRCISTGIYTNCR